jgi:hypothetical protein
MFWPETDIYLIIKVLTVARDRHWNEAFKICKETAEREIKK